MLLTRQRDLNWAFVLEIFTVAYMILEALAGLGIGLATRSISLETFGIDSLIELGSASVLLWRLDAERRGADAERVESVESQATRLAGLSLLLLAAFILFQSIYTLLAGERPEPSVWGIALAMASLIVMPLLAQVKLRVARRIASRALRADAFESIACAYLSFTLLLGLGANYFFGWWWADPIAALAMCYFIVREACEALSGGHAEEHTD